jgi:hypothetical protein
MSHRDFKTTVLERGAESGGHVALGPEVVKVGPRIGDRADTASGVRT